MFRPMRRIKQQLTEQECTQVLENEVRGVLSVLGDDDYPYSVPLNYLYSKEDNKIYFHGAKEGHKIDAMKKHNKVSFCVYDKGYLEEGKKGLNIKSVIVFGRIKITEEEKDKEKALRACLELGKKLNIDKTYIENEIQNFAKFVTFFEITPEHITGKLVNES